MRSFPWLVLIGAVALAVASCRSQEPPATPQGPVLVGTIREIMSGIIETSADVLFNAVGSTITSTGMEDREPRTDEEWDAVQHSALALAESANLLTMPGRRVARPEEENTSIDPTELTPAQIQLRIAENGDSWQKRVTELQAVAIQAMKITNERNVQGLFEIGETIDRACEGCHMEFWYPNDRRPLPGDFPR